MPTPTTSRLVAKGAAGVSEVANQGMNAAKNRLPTGGGSGPDSGSSMMDNTVSADRNQNVSTSASYDPDDYRDAGRMPVHDGGFVKSGSPSTEYSNPDPDLSTDEYTPGELDEQTALDMADGNEQLAGTLVAQDQHLAELTDDGGTAKGLAQAMIGPAAAKTAGAALGATGLAATGPVGAVTAAGATVALGGMAAYGASQTLDKESVSGFRDVATGVSDAHRSIQDSIESRLHSFTDKYADDGGASDSSGFDGDKYDT